MKRRAFISTALSIALIAGWASGTTAADLQSFEFGDASGTALASAANTASPGNLWVEDLQMFPSDVRSGAYNIVKESTALDNNYLQIANITSGTRYLVARISGWKFGATIDSANLEEVRFGFLNDDDADFGSTITAQMMIRRNADGTVELVGDALGAGSTNIAGTAALTTTRSTPLTIALELNKTSNTYKVFYKDNTSATQVLGLGNVATIRNGNAIRFSANNSFGEGNLDYPFVPADEVFSVDRIAVTDTNPFTDLITLDIDRVSGSITLRNTSGAALTGLESYSITSTSGPFDPTKWKKVTGNYDSTGNSSVDNAPWAVTSSTKTLLSEAFQSGDGGGLTNGQNVVLSVPAGGTWLQSPFEDVTAALNFAGGVTRTVSVNFVGNSNLAWTVGDLNFDNNITASDYSVLIQHAETSLAGLSRVEGYRRGDLDGDGVNSIVDFLRFKEIYEAANGGSGSFAAMLANFSPVPEPASAALLAIAAGFVAAVRQRRPGRLQTSNVAIQNSPTRHPNRDFTMSRSATLLRWVIALAAIAVSLPAARAAILEDFQFSDPNGTLLEDAENLVNSGNNWLAHMNTVQSSVLNGSYHIQKQTIEAQAANSLNIANITTGKAWLVAEIPGWLYTSTPSATSERVRFGFLDNNDPPAAGSSTITAEMTIDRSGGGLILSGEALGTGNSPIAGDYSMSLTRTTPLTIALELDKTNDTYSVFYREGNDPWGTIGTANLGASTLNAGDRDGNSVRFAFTGLFGDVGEFFDVSRIYLTDVSPLGGPIEPVALSLEVKSDGMVSIINTTDEAISFDTYRIASSTDALNFSGWTTLQSQGLDEVGGGDDPGETWSVSFGSDDGVLAETFLFGESSIAPDDFLSLGSAFKTTGDENLTFQYRDTVTGVLVSGEVDYVDVAGLPGDYNNDHVVDAADYTVWRNNLNDPTEADISNNGDGNGVTESDYAWWKQHYGNSNLGPGGGGLTQGAVPEPTTLTMLLVIALSMLVRRRPMAS